MSAFRGLFILMVATYAAFVVFMLERLRAVEALGRLFQCHKKIAKKLYKKAEKHSKSAVHLLALEGSKQFGTVHAAMNIAANKQVIRKSSSNTTFCFVRRIFYFLVKLRTQLIGAICYQRWR